MSGGLNDDFPLDDAIEVTQPKSEPVTDSEFDEVVFDNSTPGEVPDISKEVDIVVVGYDKLDDIRYLKKDILDSNGMNKQLAMEAQAIIPTFLNEDRSLGFFTDSTTKTQFKATLESIDEERVGIIKRIIESIKSFFSSIVEYLKKIYQKIRDHRFGKLEEMQAYGDIYKPDVKAAVDKMEDITKDKKHEVDTLKNTIKSKFQEIDAEAYFTELEKRFDKIERSINSLYNSINNSRIEKAIIFEPSILANCFAVSGKDNRVLDSFYTVLHMAERAITLDTSSAMEMLKSSKTVSDILAKIVVPGTELQPKQALDMLNSQLASMDSKEVTPQTVKFGDLINSFSTLFKQSEAKDIANNYLTIDVKFVELQEYFIKILDKIIQSRNQNQDMNKNKENIDQQVWNQKYKMSDEVSAIAEKMVKTAYSEIVAYSQLKITFASILSSYAVIGSGVDRLLKNYQRDVFMAASTMDEKFQDFIKNHFSNSHPEFFDRKFD